MKYLLVALLFLLNACSIKDYEHSATKILILKTPKLKFSDIGYIRNSDKAIELELFVAGHVFKRIHINHLICVEDEGCMSKSSFNAEYFNASYPDEIFQNILLGHKIYGGENTLKSKSGFIQNIETKDVSIVYRVLPKEIYFKDRKNHILIKIKEVN